MLYLVIMRLVVSLVNALKKAQFCVKNSKNCLVIKLYG